MILDLLANSPMSVHARRSKLPRTTVCLCCLLYVCAYTRKRLRYNNVHPASFVWEDHSNALLFIFFWSCLRYVACVHLPTCFISRADTCSSPAAIPSRLLFSPCHKVSENSVRGCHPALSDGILSRKKKYSQERSHRQNLHWW